MRKFFLFFFGLFTVIPFYPLHAEQVLIDGPEAPLAGELLAVEGAQDIVVIIPGSGPIDRDGNSPSMGLRTDSYRLLAEALRDRGVSSIRIDKRGFYGSAAAVRDSNAVTISAYAEDARRWVARAAQMAPRVWLAGHSEGGLVALVAAERPPGSLRGIILIAAPGRPVGHLLREQFRLNPMIAPIMPEAEKMIDDVEAGRVRDPALLPDVLRPLFSAGVQRYMIDLFSYDPFAVAQHWHGPALILQGDADIQVSLHDASRLAAAMPQAKRIDLKGATHMLKMDVAGKAYATYLDATLPLHGDLVPAIQTLIEIAGTSEEQP